MTKIIRTPTRAEGGITPEEKEKINSISRKWIINAFRTDKADINKVEDAITRLYAAAGLKKPRIILVPSPFVARLAAGIACAVWYLRKDNKKATCEAAYEAICEATYRVTDKAIYKATDEPTDEAIEEPTRVATYRVTDEAIYEATRVAIEEPTRVATYRVTDEAIYEAIRMAIEEAIDEATYEATRVAIDEATRMATDEATRVACLNNLINQFTPNNRTFTKGCITESWRIYQGGNMWPGYPCYFEAMRDVLGLTGLDCWKKYQAWEDAAQVGGFRYMHEEFCIVSDFPEILKVDEQNRAHNADGPSHRWRDGFEIYHLNGIKLTKEEWDEYRYADGKKIIQMPNADKRAALIATVGAEKIVKDCGGKVIATDKWGDLLELDGVIDGNGNPYRFLKALDPAHGQHVYLRVPPHINTPEDAEKWTYGGIEKYNPSVRV